MRKRSEAAPAAATSPVDFAPRDGEVPLAPWAERLVETVFIDDPFALYKRLEEELKVGPGRSDHGSVNRALDEAETNARLAYRLWLTAKAERERWEAENAGVFGAMREEALAVLQREKAQKIRTKQITDADVEGTCAMLYPDEYRHQHMRRRRAKWMEESMQHLAEMWSSRCRSLQTMLSKQR